MPSFYGTDQQQAYFEGWYLKHQSDTDTVALIPAFHIDEEGRRSASLQLLTEAGAFCAEFSDRDFRACRSRFGVWLGDSLFNENGCRLNVRSKDWTVRGVLRYGPMTRPAYDIMGPLRFMPAMQCRHGLLSLHHSVEGYLSINGEQVHFKDGAVGYIEGDRGDSFPKSYLWTQCSWSGNCLMLAVADIPMCGSSFTGCVGVVYYEGKEHRFATYLGAEILYVDGSVILVRQGDKMLHVELIESDVQRLRAPRAGGMTRMIHASPACKVRYRFSEGNTLRFDFVNERASFEHDWKATEK